MHFEDEAFLCSQMIQESGSQGIFAAELGHILGLEKIILCDSYFDRRETLIQTVLNEQAVQQLVKNLRVVDASIMPECVRANINVTVMTMAERIADFIKEGN